MNEEDEIGKPDIPRLRRFALVIGLLLVVFAVAGVKLKSPTEIHPLGIPFEITRPYLLDIGLIASAVYAASRYWYYAMLVSLWPREVRAIIQRDQILPSSVESRLPPDAKLKHRGALSLLSRYYPKSVIKSEAIKISVDGHVAVQVPPTTFRTRLLIFLEEIDYTAPVWVNVCAIIIYVLAR